MKKLFFGVVILCLFITACTKEIEVLNDQPNAQYNLNYLPKHQNQKSLSSVPYKLQDGRIVLDSQTDFEHFMWGLEELDLDKWEKSIAFDSYRTIHNLNESILSQSFDPEKEELTYYNKQLLSALNKHGIIQVNPYIFKLDFSSRKVYVLNQEEQEHIALLENASTSSNFIKEFSFEDDVWYLLEHNLMPEIDDEEKLSSTVVSKCSDKKSKNKSVLSEGVVCSCTLYYWEKMWIKIWYNKFGIWEDVNAVFANAYFNVYTTASNEFIAANLIAGLITFHLEERCGPVYEGVMNLQPGQFDRQIYLVHSSTKPLKRYASTISMGVYGSYIHAPQDPLQLITTQLENF